MAHNRRSATAQRYVERSGYIVSGNNAMDPSYERYPAPSLKRRPRKQAPVKYQWNLILSILIIFGGCLVAMSSVVNVFKSQRELVELRSELKQLNADITHIQGEISSQLDYDYIKEQATTRLNMGEPLEHQIVYLDVPKTNYMVEFEDTIFETEKTPSFLNRMFSFFIQD